MHHVIGLQNHCVGIGPISLTEVPLLTRALIVMFLVIPLGLSGCDTAYITAMDKMGYAKRDILSSRVKSARDAQEEAKKDIQSTLEKF